MGSTEVIAAFSFDTNNETFRYNEYTDMNEEKFDLEFISECMARSAYDTGYTAEYGDRLLYALHLRIHPYQRALCRCRQAHKRIMTRLITGKEVAMSKIKNTGNGQGHQGVDKAAVAGERMKDAFIRTKDTVQESFR